MKKWIVPVIVTTSVKVCIEVDAEDAAGAFAAAQCSTDKIADAASRSNDSSIDAKIVSSGIKEKK